MEYFSGSKKLLQFIMEDWKLLLFLTLIFGVYFYYTSTFNFFEKKGVKYMKPTIFVGNMGKRISSKVSFHSFQLEIYNYFKGNQFGGFFEGRRPILYLLDPELIKAVAIRDFDYFVDRNTLRIKEPRYLSQSLLNLKGSEWKAVRSTLTPAFSSARLKNMLQLIEHCSQQLVEFLKQYDGKDVEMKDTLGHFTLEVIGACAFGIKCDALTDENAHFVKVAEKFNYMSKSKRVLLLLTLMLMPKMLRFFNISFLNPESITELMRILQTAKAERRSTGIKKNDFLQLLIDAADTEKHDTIDSETKAKACMDDDTIDAQTLLFLLAGYETSSTLLSFAIHVLATKPELQDKLREHIEELTRGSEMSYDLLSQLSYLEGFLLETLRMYPPVSRVDRICVKPYTLPGTTVQVDVNETVAIPIYGIHMDPDYYPEPQEFRPERFIGDEKKERPSHLFLAFGVGPRNCIGLAKWSHIKEFYEMDSNNKNFVYAPALKMEHLDPNNKQKMRVKLAAQILSHTVAAGMMAKIAEGLRFAMFSAKLAMVTLLKNFKFSVCSKTNDPIKTDKRAFLLKADGGLWVRLEQL